MKLGIIAALVTSMATVSAAEQPVSNHPEHLGFGSGAIIGGVVAGPIGVVLGGLLGTLIGHDVVNDQRLADYEAELTRAAEEAALNEAEWSALVLNQPTVLSELANWRRTVSELSTGVYFETASSELNGSDRALLLRVGEAMQSIDGLTVSIKGYADRRGDAMANQVLSAHRADAVARLLSEAGVSRDRMTVTALGEAEARQAGEVSALGLDRKVALTFSVVTESQDALLSSIQ